MVSVMLEQQFLPTDTMVEFPAVLEQYPVMGNFSTIGGAFILLFGVILLLVCVFSWLNAGYLSKFNKVLSVVDAVALLAGVTMIVSGSLDYQEKLDTYHKQAEVYEKLVDEQFEKNRENLVTNIESVYDIEKIEIDPYGVAGLTSAMAEGKIGDKVVTKRTIDSSMKAVISQDGNLMMC